MKTKQPFLSDIQELRRRARAHMECGPVTSNYGADREKVIQLLNEALATELVCVLRYKSHYFTADGLQAQAVAAEFAEHAAEEQQHADQLAARIRQLGGMPNFNPEGILMRSHAEFQQGETLIQMIEEDLYAERIAIESYREIAQFIGNGDSTTRRLMESILEKEEEHAEDLQSLLVTIDPNKKINPAA